jgi:predicted HicB family RNase H-like nuclease
MEMAMEPAEMLNKPYVRQVAPQPDGLFKAEILEFPGCFAVGDTAAEALASLEEVAVDWIAATIAQGQDIPEPTESTAYSGKLVLRMSKTLHRKAAQFALRDGVSLNQFIVNCVAEHVGMLARPSMVYFQPLRATTTLEVGTSERRQMLEFKGGLQQAVTLAGRVPISFDRWER